MSGCFGQRVFGGVRGRRDACIGAQAWRAHGWRQFNGAHGWHNPKGRDGRREIGLERSSQAQRVPETRCPSHPLGKYFEKPHEPVRQGS